MFCNQQRQIRKSNTAIPVSYVKPNEKKKNRLHETYSLPYSAAGNIYHQTSVPLEKLFRKNLQSAQLIESATQNRISFGLPTYLTPKLVQLCKDVTIDKRALNKVNFSGTLATKSLWNGNIEKSKGYRQDAKVSFCEHRLVQCK